MTLCSLLLSSDLNESFTAFFVFQQMQSLLLFRNTIISNTHVLPMGKNLNICSIFTGTFEKLFALLLFSNASPSMEP